MGAKMDITADEFDKQELDWYNFLETKGRYIGGVVESHEGVGGNYRGIISSIKLDGGYFRVFTDNAEENLTGKWKPFEDYTIDCAISSTSSPIVNNKGVAKLHLYMIGEVFLFPAKQLAADLEGKVVVMESGVKDEEGHLFSVQSCECFAEENDGTLEYLANGEVKVWVSPEINWTALFVSLVAIMCMVIGLTTIFWVIWKCWTYID
ncbi:hypothetical protein LCGC14_1634660 [marine sediment metagenome]|uniref:Uncharacterized protein n=1 Tax=marine sediment metagenome TaxID=412755 RepID=A0A0F9I1Y4_9ZZZZ